MPSLAETREAVLNIRRAKSMVIDADDPNSKSAGSFFKNPIVPASSPSEIAESLKVQNVPSFRLNESEAKIPAAWLIENAGFSKGYIHGNAGISSNHSLAIINRGSSSANEIVELKNMIQKAVKDRFGIELQPEPIFVGF
jgi:UDP-N-acetylmuramate dehydrogenase